MTQYTISLSVSADGKLAVRGLKEVEAAEKGVEDQTRRGASATAAAKSQLEQYMASVRKEAETLGLSRDKIRLYEAARLGATATDLRAIQVSNQMIAAQERNAAVVGMLTSKLAALGSLAGIALLAKELADLGDHTVLLHARISALTSSEEEQRAVMEAIFATAQKLELPFRSLADQFPKLAAAVKYFGGSNRDAIDLLTVLATTAKMAGKSEEDAAAQAALFANALQDGSFQGRELKSMLNENAPLARALAAGLGVTTAELRRMGDDGVLSVREAVRALISQLPDLQKKGAEVPHTIAGAWDALANEIKHATGESHGFITSQQAIVAGFAAIREFVEWSRKNPWSVSGPLPGGSSAGFQLGQMMFGGAAATPAKPKPTVSSEADPGQRLAAAQGQLRSLVLQADTVSGINARFDQELRKLDGDIIALRAAGGYDAKAQAQYQELVSQAYLRRQLALEALAQKGVASQQSEIEALKKRSDLEGAAAANYYALQQDSVQRSLAAEDFYHQASITGEREYINRKAALEREGAQYAVDQATSEVERQKALLANLNAQLPKAPTPTARTQLQGQIADQDKAVGEARKNLAVATRNLEDVEVRRGRNATLYEKQLQEAILAVTNARRDYANAVQRDLRDLELEIDLIGKSELAQAKARKERELRNQAGAEELRLEDAIKKARKDGADEKYIGELEASLKALHEQLEIDIDDFNRLFDDQAAKNFALSLSTSITDALFSAAKGDGPKAVYTAVVSEFTKPIKVAFQGMLKDLIGGLLSNIGITPQLLQGPLGVAAAGGYLAGSTLPGLFGAGPRGSQVGALAGAGLSMIGFAVGGPIGAVIGAIAGAAIGYFTDPHGDAMRTARFGQSPSGRYQNAGTATSAFGTFGFFDDHWFSDTEMGTQLRTFLQQEARFENVIASHLSASERERVSARLAGTSAQYNFGMEHGDVTGLGEITRDRMAQIVDAVLPGLGQLVSAFQGTGQELETFVQSIFAIRDSVKDIDGMIASLSGNAVDAVRAQIDALNTQVDRAKGDLSAALDSKDPTAILQAEQTLTTAVMNRYNAEIQMVQQLRDAIQQLKQEAFQFQLSIAQRINAVGGSVDIGALAMNRATSLRAGIGGDNNLPGQITDLNSYVGAIDAWYESRKSAIEQQMNSERDAAAAIAQAQQAAAQVRIAQLNGELQLAKEYQSVVDRTRQMIDDLRFSSANPAPAAERAALEHTNIESLRAQYHAATGDDRVKLANQILDALGTYSQLGQEAYDRPSGDWQRISDEIMSDLTEVQSDAKSFAEQSVDLEQRILDVQTQAAAAQQAAASAANASSHYLDALNAEALPYYTWAQQEGERLYTTQERHHQEQLDAITGGTDVDLFIASVQRDARDELRFIRSLIQQFLNGGAPVTGGSTKPPYPLDTSGGGTTPGGGDVYGPSGTGPSSGGKSVTLVLPPGASAKDMLDVIARNSTQIRRMLETS